MTLDRAIEIQTIHNDHNPTITDAEREEAHQLGIEALKHVQNERAVGGFGREVTLPGLTEE